jgi:COP9 signalosome complex subunit 6
MVCCRACTECGGHTPARTGGRGACEAALTGQLSAIVDTPILLQFNPDIPAGAKDLPLTLYESALIEGKDAEGGAKFVRLEYGVETGEAERIAVDGAQRGGMGSTDDSQGESSGT